MRGGFSVLTISGERTQLACRSRFFVLRQSSFVPFLIRKCTSDEVRRRSAVRIEVRQMSQFDIRHSTFAIRSESPRIATGRIVTATPELRTRARAATCCSLHHCAVARRAMRRLERSSVRSRFTNVPCGSSPDPPQQFAQQHSAASAKDDHRPGLPHQSVHELVKLRMGHIHICCEFHANRADR
jgi:hypothetical protein